MTTLKSLFAVVYLLLLTQAAVSAQTGTYQILLDAPSGTGDYYGMYCVSCIGAQFTLNASYYVSTIDVVVRTPSGTTYTNFNFSLLSSVSPVTTVVSQALTAQAGVTSTLALTVNQVLPAGTYYLIGNVPGYFGSPVTPGDVDGWFISDGAYSGTGGTIANGVGGFQGSNWVINNNPGYYAPAFTVNGSPMTAGSLFVAATPCRVADTRGPTGAFGGPELSGGTSREFDIPNSSCGIPSTAVAYSLNVTVVPNDSLDYLTLWPSGQPQPFVSTLNSDGRVKASAAITPAGVNGGVSVFVSDASQVILDIDGYFVPVGTASALAFYPVTPCRVADTRNVAGPLGGPFLAGGTSRNFPVQSSSCGLPSTAQAYSLNVTAVPHSTLNYLTTWPTGQTQPYVSTLNSSTGAVTANAAIVPAGSGGAVSVFVYNDADVILDVNGYFAPPATGGLSLYAVTPCRALDTRPTAFNGIL